MILILAEFEYVFLHDPSFEATCAQNKSCRPSIPLQLLFWPNFMFQCKISSFGWSKSGQKSVKMITVLHGSSLCLPRPSQRRRPPRVAIAGEPRSPHVPYPLVSSGGFSSSSLSPSSRPRQAEPERAVIVAVAAPTTPSLSRSIPRVLIPPSLYVVHM